MQVERLEFNNRFSNKLRMLLEMQVFINIKAKIFDNFDRLKFNIVQKDTIVQQRGKTQLFLTKNYKLRLTSIRVRAYSKSYLDLPNRN